MNEKEIFNKAISSPRTISFAVDDEYLNKEHTMIVKREELFNLIVSEIEGIRTEMENNNFIINVNRIEIFGYDLRMKKVILEAFSIPNTGDYTEILFQFMRQFAPIGYSDDALRLLASI